MSDGISKKKKNFFGVVIKCLDFNLINRIRCERFRLKATKSNI